VPSGQNTPSKVIEAGYKSNSASFRQIVNQTLADGDQFERVERGRYTVKQA